MEQLPGSRKPRAVTSHFYHAFVEFPYGPLKAKRHVIKLSSEASANVNVFSSACSPEVQILLSFSFPAVVEVYHGGLVGDAKQIFGKHMSEVVELIVRQDHDQDGRITLTDTRQDINQLLVDVNNYDIEFRYCLVSIQLSSKQIPQWNRNFMLLYCNTIL